MEEKDLRTLERIAEIKLLHERNTELVAKMVKAKALAHEQEEALLREGIRADEVAAELKSVRTQLADLHVRHQELHDNYEAMQKNRTRALPELAHWTQTALDRGETINELRAALRNTEAELAKAKQETPESAVVAGYEMRQIPGWSGVLIFCKEF